MNRTCWSIIFNLAALDQDKADCDKGIRRYISNKTLLSHYLEHQYRIHCGKANAAIGVESDVLGCPSVWERGLLRPYNYQALGVDFCQMEGTVLLGLGTTTLKIQTFDVQSSS